MAGNIILYSSPISDCSGRLRIALNAKELPYTTRTVSLRSGQNDRPQYREINANGTIPTLVISAPERSESQESLTLTQSVATLEYLDEAFPSTRQLLPPLDQPTTRASVRSLVNIIVTDIHPLTTHRVGRAIAAHFPGPQVDLAKDNGNMNWDVYWIRQGLAAYERTAEKTAGKCSVGNEITLADVCLLPELWTAERLGVDIAEYPTVFRIYNALSSIPSISSARQDPSTEL